MPETLHTGGPVLSKSHRYTTAEARDEAVERYFTGARKRA